MNFTFDDEDENFETYGGLARVTSIIGMLNVGEKDAFLKDWAGQKALEHCLYNGLWDEINSDPDLIPELVKTHKKAWRKELAKAGRIGTLAHKMIECVICMRMLMSKRWDDRRSTPKLKPINEYDPDIYEHAERAFLGWKNWAAECGDGFDPILSEERIRSEKLGYGGTVDCVAEYRGGIWIVDWKTSNRIDSQKFALQGIAYKKLCEEELGLKIDGIEIVRCDKKVKRGKYETMTINHKDDFEELEEIFGYLLRIRQILEA